MGYKLHVRMSGPQVAHLKEMSLDGEDLECLIGFADQLHDGILRNELLFISAWCKVRSAAADFATYCHLGELTGDAHGHYFTLLSHISNISAFRESCGGNLD